MEEIFEKSMENEKIKNEQIINDFVNEVPAAEVVESPKEETPMEPEEPKSCEKKKCKCHLAHLIFDLLMLAAVITLFVLHFTSGKKTAQIEKPAEVGNGEIIYINIDSINENYELVKILTDSIDADKQKQAVVLRSDSGAQHICDALTIIETAKMQHKNVYDTVENVFEK